MAEVLRRALAEISPAEWAAVLLALAYLVLAIRQSAWCWACAIASSLIYLVLFARAGLVMQAALQVFYVAMAVYGAWAWRRGGQGATELPVTRWPGRAHAAAIAGVLVVSAINGHLESTASSPTVAYLDAFVAWSSVLATWMVTRKLIENWLYWIVIDLVAAALYGSQGLRATAVLFVVYTVLAVRGYVEWRRDLRRQPGLAGARAEHA